MPKRKTKLQPKKRTRRSAYDRALEDATARLEKALSEQVRHQEALEALAREIPYLQGIIRALGPEDEAPAVRMTTTLRKLGVRGKVTDQADFLAKFVKPLETNVMRATPPIVIDETADEPFLPPVGGAEVLE